MFGHSLVGHVHLEVLQVLVQVHCKIHGWVVLS